ncbi:MAG: LacI family transcriptional regulator [Akkermansiaceae bacterium]|nr:LacI family transcriptional regulator [Akkermansiaceae bacterium]
MNSSRNTTKLCDIAAAAGCSVATISNAVNGRGRMSEETRREILRLCAEMNFVPNSAGRSLRLRRADAVGVIYAPSFSELFGNVFYARIMEGMAEAFGRAGMDLVLGHRMAANGVPEIVKQGKVDALVVLAGVFERETFGILRDCPVPVCLVDGHDESLRADSLTTDGFGGGRLVAGHLVEHGHREVLMVAYATPLYNIEQRIAGFLAGLRDAGMDAPAERVVVRVANDDGAVIQVLGRMRQAQPPTAVFAVNDTLAQHLVTTLTAAGVKIPEEMSVVGFDDDPLAARCVPPLTPVGIAKRDLGAISAKMVLERLRAPGQPPCHQVQPTHLVIRDSVATLK